MTRDTNPVASKYSFIKTDPPSPFKLDYKKLLFETIRFWWLFVITVPLALFLVYMMHRYTRPVYRASMTLLMDEHGMEKRQNRMMEGFGLSSGMRSIDNQIAILQSWEMIRETVRELDFNVSYYQSGRIKSTELYNITPIKVNIDTLFPQLINTPIYLTLVDEDHFRLSVFTKDASTYILSNRVTVAVPGEIKLEATYKFGEWIETPWLRVKIENRNLSDPREKGHFFVINNPEALTSKYQGVLTARKTGENTGIVNISITGNNSQKNIDFLNTLVRVFMRENLEKKNQIATNTIRFIEEQLLVISDSLISKGTELSHFRTSHQVQSISTQATLLFSRIEELAERISNLRLSKNYYNYLKNYFSSDTLFEQSIAPAAFPITNEIVAEHVKKIIDLNNELQMFERNQNPYFLELLSKLEIARRTLLNGLDNQIQIIEIETNRLKSLHAETASQLYQLPEIERKLLGIERQFDLNNEVYTFLLRQRSEAQIQKASNTPDHAILETARFRGQVYPTTSKDRERAVLIGILIPLAFVLTRHLLDNKINSSDDVERVTQLPLLGHIIHNSREGNNIVGLYPKSVISETFRRVRTRMMYMNGDVKSPVISISSSMQGEGKTFCAANLASVFAISGKKTVLVGFDMRKPGLDKVYELDNRTGLSRYLIGEATLDDIIQTVSQENLYLIGAGPIPPNPSELISSPRTTILFEELKGKFDVILVDTPPMGIVTDGFLLAHHANSIIFLARHGFTVKDIFIQTLRQMHDEGITNVGILVNDINVKSGILGYRYNYGYGYGYGYGKGYYED